MHRITSIWITSPTGRTSDPVRKHPWQWRRRRTHDRCSSHRHRRMCSPRMRRSRRAHDQPREAANLLLAGVSAGRTPCSSRYAGMSSTPLGT